MSDQNLTLLTKQLNMLNIMATEGLAPAFLAKIEAVISTEIFHKFNLVLKVQKTSSAKEMKLVKIDALSNVETMFHELAKYYLDGNYYSRHGSVAYKLLELREYKEDTPKHVFIIDKVEELIELYGELISIKPYCEELHTRIDTIPKQILESLAIHKKYIEENSEESKILKERLNCMLSKHNIGSL